MVCECERVTRIGESLEVDRNLGNKLKKLIWRGFNIQWCHRGRSNSICSLKGSFEATSIGAKKLQKENKRISSGLVNILL